MPADLEGTEVVPNTLPGIGTQLIINGNIFRIVYTKPGADPFRFTAELKGRYEPKEPHRPADSESD